MSNQKNYTPAEQGDVRYILALDLATTTGWALVRPGSVIDSGTIDLSVKKDQSDTLRMVKFRNFLNQTVEEEPEFNQYGLVCWEMVEFVKYRMAYRVHVQLTSAAALWCHDNQVPHDAVGVTKIKQHATGKGNASKKMMLDGARAKWPLVPIKDDNEADARWLADLMVQKLSVQ